MRSYLAEINLGNPVPGAGGAIMFNDYPQLRNVVIFGIEAIDNTILANSPTQQAIVSTLTGITVTIADKTQKNIIEEYPTYDLSPVNIGGYYREFRPFELNLVKSFIRIVDPSIYAANESICFNVFYCTIAELNEQNKKAAAVKKAPQFVRR